MLEGDLRYVFEANITDQQIGKAAFDHIIDHALSFGLINPGLAVF
jgi:hypothetical protein